jgi:DNA-binding transcriptional regulator LsrR (DeoR family)
MKESKPTMPADEWKEQVVPPSEDPVRALQAARVARRHFIDGISKTEIATEFAISRFQVARLLDWARASGLVEITVREPRGIDLALSERLQTRFRLRTALVASLPSLPDDHVRDELARIAALHVTARLEAADVVGLAWGRTIDRLVDQLGEIPPVTTVQIAGGMTPIEHALSGADMVRKFARRARGSVYPILAPLVVKDAATAASLRSEVMIASTLRMFSKVSVAIVGIGSWDPPTSLLLASLSAQDRRSMHDLGAVADMCSTVLDASGAEVGQDLGPRALCISTDQLRRIPEVIAVAGGLTKQTAIAAALRSGIIKTLITDSVVARSVLAEA